MAINKTAKNMYINIKGTHTVIAKEIVITAEKVSIIATKGDLTLISNKKVIIKGKDGVKFGDYVAPTEEKHPEIVEVQFLDENNKVLKQETLAEFGNIQATNFAIGKKIKIKIITKDVIDLTKISFDLKAETKSPNQKFFGLDKQKWNLEIKGNTCETPFFEFDNLWFSEDFEKYNYTSHLNEITSDELNSFYVKGTLNAKPFELPNKTDRLKPVTYLRNYEELIGLFHTNNTKTKDLVDNFENKYIAGSMFENITRDFSEFINHTQNLTISQIKTRVEQDAKLLWETAIKQVQSGNLDDRPLYWARIKMQVRLKQHYLFEKDIDFKTSTINVGSELEKIIQLFEINSRNYTGIDFSKTPVGKKKLLISGYDPFVMNPEKSGNPRQSNPSGVTALSLHGKTIGNYYIQTFVFPVRYKDFDEFKNGKGVIETFFEPHIQNVDMIITVSQGGDFRFDVDRFPCKNRGGYMDNMFWGVAVDGYNQQYFKQLAAGKEFYETTLPYRKIVPNKNNPTDTFWTYFNQTFDAVGDSYDKEDVEGILLNKKISDIQSLKSISGSGSNYLSNEIFYRVAKMRTEQRLTLATGHLHIPRIQQKLIKSYPRGNSSTEDINPKITNLVAQIKTIISKI